MFSARLVQQQSVEGSGVILAFDWRNGSRKSLHACVSKSRRTVLKQAFLFCLAFGPERHTLLRNCLLLWSGQQGKSMKGMAGVAFSGCFVRMPTGLLRLCE